MTPAKRVLSISGLVAIFVAALAIGGVVMNGGRWMEQVQGNTDRSKTNEKKIHDIEKIVTSTNAIVTRIDKQMDREHP